MTDRELVSAYVLGDLEAPARAELERRFEREPALRSELEATRLLSAGLEALPADAWPGETASEPSPQPRAAPTRAAPTGPPSPETPRRAPKRSRRWFAQPAFALGAVIAALVIGVAVGDLIGGGSSDSGGRSTAANGTTVALRSLESGVRASATVRVGSDRTVELDTRDLPSPGNGHYYEFWLMTNAAKTVPVASFGVGGDGTAKVRVPLPANPSRFRYYDVSRQRIGAGTAHSTESVLRGPTS